MKKSVNDTRNVAPRMPKKATGESEKGSGSFIPYILEMMVGMVRIMVIAVSKWITRLRLLVMMVE